MVTTLINDWWCWSSTWRVEVKFNLRIFLRRLYVAHSEDSTFTELGLFWPWVVKGHETWISKSQEVQWRWPWLLCQQPSWWPPMRPWRQMEYPQWCWASLGPKTGQDPRGEMAGGSWLPDIETSWHHGKLIKMCFFSTFKDHEGPWCLLRDSLFHDSSSMLLVVTNKP